MDDDDDDGGRAPNPPLSKDDVWFVVEEGAADPPQAEKSEDMGIVGALAGAAGLVGWGAGAGAGAGSGVAQALSDPQGSDGPEKLPKLEEDFLGTSGFAAA